MGGERQARPEAGVDATNLAGLNLAPLRLGELGGEPHLQAAGGDGGVDRRQYPDFGPSAEEAFLGYWEPRIGGRGWINLVVLCRH